MSKVNSPTLDEQQIARIYSFLLRRARKRQLRHSTDGELQCQQKQSEQSHNQSGPENQSSDKLHD